MNNKISTSKTSSIVPSKSTVYVSNLPFSLTNNDLHKIFDKYGKVARITIVKEKDTRKSKGVAFVFFVDREAARNCVKEHNNVEIGGRKIKCSIAKDNGRAPEFIKRKVYKDKSRCYECGEEGHLSYCCEKNILGPREPPPKKERKNKDKNLHNNFDSENEKNKSDEESFIKTIIYQTLKESSDTNSSDRRKKYVKDSYFSDEEALD